MLSKLLGKGIGRSFLSSKALLSSSSLLSSSLSSSSSSLLALGGLERGLSVSLICLVDFWGEAGRGLFVRKEERGGEKEGNEAGCAISLHVFGGEMQM